MIEDMPLEEGTQWSAVRWHGGTWQRVGTSGDKMHAMSEMLDWQRDCPYGQFALASRISVWEIEATS